MRAVRVHEFGGPDKLVVEDVPIPSPSAGEILVRIGAAGVGPWDALIREGKSGLPQRLPLTPGSDIAGIVAASPDASFRIGDRVYGVTNASFTGGYADYAVASVHGISHAPVSLGFAEAASVPVVAVTAWQMLFDRAGVTRGQTVLVHGAAGNVGAYAVQLAHQAGARVVATAGAGDAAYVRDLGAAETIDFRTERFEDRVRDVDAVIDTIGGDTQDRSFAVLARGGVLVSSVSAPAPEKAAERGVRVAYFIVDVTASALATIARLIDDGKLAPDLGVVLPLEAAREAHEMLAGSRPHPRGKIVLGVAALAPP